MPCISRPLVVITDGSAEDFGGEQAIYIQVPKPEYPITMPLTQFAPVCLIAAYIAELTGEEYGRGCEGDWSFSKNGAGVTESEIIV